MTVKQKEQFNRMRNTLNVIAKGYQAPGELRRSAERVYGLEYEEVLEMAYENIKDEARQACRGVRAVK